MAAPPAWLLAALAAPHAFALLPLLAPKQLAVVAARLGHTDAGVLHTAGSLVFGAGQAGAVLQFFVEGSRGSEALGGGVPFAARAALALPLLLTGGALKLGARRRTAAAFFGKHLAAPPDKAQPQPTAWPYSAVTHPDYCGSALILLGCGALLLGGAGAPEGGVSALLFWIGLYLASAMVEEAYACAGQPHPLLKPGQNPFWNNMYRPESAVEKARQLLMAPIALLRCCVFWGALFTYGLFVTVLNKFYVGRDRERHALLVPITRISVHVIMFICGYSIVVRGAGNFDDARRKAAASNGSFEIVGNHLSYMDIVFCAAVFGPYSAVARHDLLDWPIVGPVARAWGVVGVVQSDIREKELSASTAEAPAAGGEAKRAPSGRAAALAARAALPGSGWALPPVLVFPEGTTGGGGCIVTFRSGAFVAGVPVLPVTLRYSTPSGFNLCWACPLGTGAHFWKTMCAWGKRVEVDILPLHTPTAAEVADARVFSDVIRGKMAASLGWPAVEGYSVREAHALMHELTHGGGPLSRAAAAAAAMPGSAPDAEQAETPPRAAAPAAALPPLPPQSPSSALAARHRGGSGAELFPPSAGAPAAGAPSLARTSSSSPGSLRGRCPSPKQA